MKSLFSQAFQALRGPAHCFGPEAGGVLGRKGPQALQTAGWEWEVVPAGVQWTPPLTRRLWASRFFHGASVFSPAWWAWTLVRFAAGESP